MGRHIHSISFLIAALLAPDSTWALLESDTAPKRLREAIAELESVDAEWRLNDADFRALRESGSPSDTEVREYAEFVADLQRRVFEACEAVRQLGGNNEQHSVDCVVVQESESPSDALQEVLDQASSQPTEQQTAEDLEKRLKQIEGGFDGMILTQQEKIAGRRESSPYIKSWPDEEPDPSSEGGVPSEGRAGETDRSQEGGQGQSAPEYERGAGPGVDKGDVPDSDVEARGDSSDDDIVARQLREAAMTETDPALKEQLWKEYERYKSSL
jgi:hypothetical protein